MLAITILMAASAMADQLEAICDGVAPADGLCEVHQRPKDGAIARIYAQAFGSDPLAPFDRSIAVIVGIGEYDGAYNDLTGRVDDAKRMRNFLLDEAGFDTVLVLTDRAASRLRIERLMGEILPAVVGPDDRLLFHFTGHGETRDLPGGRQRGYLVTSAATSTANWFNMISMEAIQTWSLDLARARHSLWLVDACFSGLAGAQTMSGWKRTTRDRLAQRAHHILTAGLEDEEAIIVHGRSVFTNAFIEAARRADLAPGGEPDGIVSLNEILVYVNNEVDRAIDRQNARQITDRFKMSPQLAALQDDDGEFFFVSSGANFAGIDDRVDAPSEMATPMGVPLPDDAARDAGIFEEPLGTAATNSRAHRFATLGPQEGSPQRMPGREKPDRLADCDSCPTIVVLPTGRFQMGSDFGPDIEKPRHAAEISEAFAIGETEVTNKQWSACVAADACPAKEGQPNLPVTSVTWPEIEAYLDWLSDRSGHNYRLPTEMEWEYAAQGGRGFDFPTGDVAIPREANFDGQQSGPRPVASYPANPFGLHDLAGNVWEWVEDCAGPYSEVSGDATISRPGCTGILRGGSWRSGSQAIRSANRYFYPRNTAQADFGFRVVRPLTYPPLTDH